MSSVRINCLEITDWSSFHGVFKKTMGFPEFYGNNMNAWIDCMSYLDENEGMSHVKIEKGTVLIVELVNSNHLSTHHPEIYSGLIECAAAVNEFHD